MKNSVNEVKGWINSKVWFYLFRFDGFISKLGELRQSGAVLGDRISISEIIIRILI